jgi:hypothetical protein
MHLKENNVPQGNMKEVVELLLCFPGSNVAMERMFIYMNYRGLAKQWKH